MGRYFPREVRGVQRGNSSFVIALVLLLVLDLTPSITINEHDYEEGVSSRAAKTARDLTGSEDHTKHLPGVRKRALRTSRKRCLDGWKLRLGGPLARFASRGMTMNPLHRRFAEAFRCVAERGRVERVED